jgi:probable blue pigment (indigoidine) exporter
MRIPTVAADPRVVLVLAAASWGFGTVISKQAVAEIPPLTLLPIQLAISLAFLVIAGWLRGDQHITAQIGRPVGWLGILNPGLAYALSLIGLALITASLSVLLWAAEPVLILLAAAAFLGERIERALVLLSAAALAGLVVVVYDPAAGGAVPGIVLSLAGIGCCVLYTIATRHWLPELPSTLGVVVAQEVYALGFAAVVLLGVAAVGGQVIPTSLTPIGLGSAVVSGFVYYGLAYWFYLTGLRHLPASTAAVSFYLIPLFGIAAATAFGERLEAIQWLGAAVVIIAVASIGIRIARPASAAVGPLISGELRQQGQRPADATD